MTTTHTKRETDLGPAVKRLMDFYSKGFVVAHRFDVPVILNGETVSVDHIVRNVTQSDVFYLTIEYKTSLTERVLEQGVRWREYANRSFIAIPTPEHKSKTHKARLYEAARLGLGVIYVNGEAADFVEQADFNATARIELIEQAFNAGDSEFDPAPGSAGVKRQTKARSQYTLATKTLRDIVDIHNQPAWCSWLQVKRENPTDEFIQSTTPAQALKDARRGVWRGVEFNDKRCPTVFRAKGAKP